MKHGEGENRRAKQRGGMRHAFVAQEEPCEKEREEDLQTGHGDDLMGQRDEERRQKNRREGRGLTVTQERVAGELIAIPQRRAAGAQLLARDLHPRQDLFDGVVRQRIARLDGAENAAIRIAAHDFIERNRDAGGENGAMQKPEGERDRDRDDAPRQRREPSAYRERDEERWNEDAEESHDRDYAHQA